MTQTDFSSQLKAVLADQGIESAIALLNSRTDCRFTSMFRFDGELLRPLTFYDRTDPEYFDFMVGILHGKAS